MLPRSSQLLQKLEQANDGSEDETIGNSSGTLPLAHPVFQDTKSSGSNSHYDLSIKGTKPVKTVSKNRIPIHPSMYPFCNYDVASESEDDQDAGHDE